MICKRIGIVIASSVLMMTAVYADSATEIQQRIQPVGQVTVADATPAAATSGATSGAATSTAPTQERVLAIYSGHCIACHKDGLLSAPKAGKDGAKDWSARLDTMGKGKPEAEQIVGLSEVANKGKGAMPPNGTCTDCSKEELQATIHYMIHKDDPK